MIVSRWYSTDSAPIIRIHATAGSSGTRDPIATVFKAFRGFLRPEFGG
jgi:hypothetical protein